MELTNGTPAKTLPLLVRISEAARLLGFGRSTVYEMVAKGELPSIRYGTARRIPLAAIHKWIDDQSRQSS